MKVIFTLIIVLTRIGYPPSNIEKIKYQSKGTIIGLDNKDCMCCGGWLITINKKQYQFDTVPKSANINLEKEKFPVKVKLDWQVKTKGCANWIIIQKITKY